MTSQYNYLGDLQYFHYGGEQQNHSATKQLKSNCEDAAMSEDGVRWKKTKPTTTKVTLIF